MVLGLVIHSGGGEATPTASPYATAFAILAGAALACILLLRDPSDTA